ncbi:hypothetical protein EAG_06059 [Camponotus floridanus]|uniref:Uncharacterized protein n=1 Tax=Camponotus floridanus TaxID=104421 RepID=E1ZZQ2_CAMFO|nr:hypothetical protein EAG_06059 [Camponotus floridanus]
MKRKGWRWKARELEEVKEFKYLGYVLQRNGEQEAQVRDRVKRAMAVMGQALNKDTCLISAASAMEKHYFENVVSSYCIGHSTTVWR